jgi:anhydro-N-acetylmuramic acid kinase
MMIKAPESARILGLMSGTSCDGLDMALLEFGPEGRWEMLRSGEQRFDHQLRSRLLAASDSNTVELARLRFDWMRWCGDQVGAFLDGQPADLVVSHGQTVFHDPPHATWQLGDGNVLAVACELPVLWNLRSADVAAGGQGAPLVPVPDRFFFEPSSGSRWLLNVGGIANLTSLIAGEDGWAGDVGPGNCWVDRWVELRSGGSLTMDTDGSISARGLVDSDLLARLLDAVRPSLGSSLARETFSREWLASLISEHVRTEDAARTLIALSVELIAEAVERHHRGARDLYVAGGGARNLTLMADLQRRLPELTVQTFDALGMSGDAREAACFACLGWLFLQGKSGASTLVTGAEKPKILGSLAFP